MYVFRNAGARNEAMAYITGGLIAWEQHCISDTLSKVTPTAVHAASQPHIRLLQFPHTKGIQQAAFCCTKL